MRSLVLVPAVALGLAAAVPASGADDAGAPSPVPACISVTGEARYVPYGYNHVVVLKNGCSKDAACTVATDVNPQTQNVDVKSGATAEVVTFMGSPSQAFSPRVACKLR